MLNRRYVAAAALLSLFFAAPPAGSFDLEHELGRNDVRILSGRATVPIGRTVVESRWLQRLESRGYRRVHEKPTAAGEYFFGHQTFWVFRQPFTIGGKDFPSALWGFALDRKGKISHAIADDRTPLPQDLVFLEPVLLSESLDADRALRTPLDISTVPEHVWRAVLAIEDHRFFEHRGVDGKAIARALLKNLKKGGVREGGSTITQQLVKNRDLSPKRSLGRKASEAVRALALEGEYSKEEILQAYLNNVYMGHVNGLGVYGFGSAAEVYFSRSVEDLDLAQAAALAALIQAPNRMHPARHPDRLLERRNIVLDRLSELGWIAHEQARSARGTPLGIRSSEPVGPIASALIRWTRELYHEEAPRRSRRGRGAVVESTLDPLLQRHAMSCVGQGLARLRRHHRIERDSKLQAALVALDVVNGNILAYVASDPSNPDSFDRVRTTRRQPGSLLKPLLLLEAFQACGAQSPLHPATRVADTRLTMSLPSGPWSPQNPDGRFREAVEIRDALTQSLNIPFVRIARHCGFDRMAARVRSAGIDVAADPPPAFVLGAVEASPLQILRAFTVFATPGDTTRPRPVTRISRPSGRGIERFGIKHDRVTGGGSAYLVNWLLHRATLEGTAQGVRIEGIDVAAKTGTSSGGRDAWLVGMAGSVMAVVWVGHDDNLPLGLSGAASAGPIWRQFMEVAALARPDRDVPRPKKIREAYVDRKRGLRVRSGKNDARLCLFRKGTLPRKDRPILRDRPEAVIK